MYFVIQTALKGLNITRMATSHSPNSKLCS
jgi:hypothetical protein